MVLVNATVVGAEGVLRRLRGLPATADEVLFAVTHKLTIDLQAYVKDRKLSGQVLNVKTDRLRGNINAKVERLAPAVIQGTVGTNVIYGRIHEFGGEIFPKNALALHFQIDGKDIYAKRVVMPERSFLRSALAENRPYILQSFARTAERIALARFKEE